MTCACMSFDLETQQVQQWLTQRLRATSLRSQYVYARTHAIEFARFDF